MNSKSRKSAAVCILVCVLAIFASDQTTIVASDRKARVSVPNGTPIIPLVINEFRFRGTAGATDEFIEIANNSDNDHTVAGGGTGYALVISDGTVIGVIPNGTVVPAHGHYLFVNSAGYSIGTYPAGNGTTATGDATYTTDIEVNTGTALFNTSVTADFTLANRIDAVGATSEANTLYKEGTGYTAITTSTSFNINDAFYRDTCGKGGSITDFAPCTQNGTVKDTDNNAADFVFVDTNGTSAGAGQRLGAPGPENLSSPITNNTNPIDIALLDTTVAKSAAPNRVYDPTSDAANNSQDGTYDIRRVFTNNTGAAITRLRLRIIDLTTFPAPMNIADLRPRTSTAVVVAVSDNTTCSKFGGTAPCNITVQGTTLEQPPSQPNGGGFNSSMSAGTVTLATPLADGDSIALRFLLGAQQLGAFRFAVQVEALPEAGGSFADSVAPTTDLSVTNSDSPDPVVAGNNITYTINVTNSAAADAINAVLTDAVPSNTTFVSFTAPAGWTATTPAVGGTGDVTATNPSFPASGTASFTLVVNVNSATAGGSTITDTATIAADNPDSNGADNTATATTSVTAAACTLTCPANITVSNDPNQCGAVVNYPAATMSGSCGTVTYSIPSGSFFPKGTTTVSVSSSTGGGSCSFTVTVNDTQAPSITCPANINQAAPACATSSIVNYTTPTATDNCPGVTTSCAPVSGSSFNVGTTPVVCTATDSSGNTAMCNFSVTVTSTPGSPTLTTQASADDSAPFTISDTATLAHACSGATGTITFKLYGPDDSTCGAAPIFTSAKTVTGNGNYTSDPYTPVEPGTYRWIASYSGDNNNDAVSGSCNDPNEAVAIGTDVQNLSTRLNAQTGDNIGIGGFIISGNTPKKVIVRGLGPSLQASGLSGVLADPTLELHGRSGFQTIKNDNWRDTQEAAIKATGIPPTNDVESAIVATLPPGAYTALLKGKNGGTGLSMVEVYNLDNDGSTLANISTRALVGTSDDVVIAGFILPAGPGNDHVVIRGLGPSLKSAGLQNALADPALQLYDSNGTVLFTNNDWKDSASQAAEITAAGLPPSNAKEAAISAHLVPGAYTAVLSGTNGGTGIGLVEVYRVLTP